MLRVVRALAVDQAVLATVENDEFQVAVLVLHLLCEAHELVVLV